MRWRGPAQLAVFLTTVTFISGCTYLGDWSNQHHMRLYERFRLVSHHDLSDGRPEDAISNAKRALAELQKAKPNDQTALDSSLLELGGIYLAGNLPKEALNCYNQVGVDASKSDQLLPDLRHGPSTLKAEAITGKGFCFLKMNEAEKASHAFQQALDLYKDESAKSKIVVFPIDLCQSCCQWGLEQSNRILRNRHEFIEFKMIESKPLPCLCVTTRSILARGTPLKSTVHGVTASDNSSPLTTGTTNGAGGIMAEKDLHSSWTTLIQAGKRSLRQKEFAKGERYFKSAINLLHKNNDKGARLLESLQCLSFFYSMHDRRAEALPYLKEEVELQRERFGNNDVALAAPLCRYASACIREEKLDNADQLLKQALELSDRFLKDDSETSAIIHSNLCELRLLQGRYNEAEMHGRKSLEIFQKVNPHNKARIASTNFLLARAYLAENKLAEAQAAMKPSLLMMELGEVPPNMKVMFLFTEAKLALKLKDIKSAKLAVEDARNLLNKMRSHSVTDNQSLVKMEATLRQLETMTNGAVK